MENFKKIIKKAVLIGRIGMASAVPTGAIEYSANLKNLNSNKKDQTELTSESEETKNIEVNRK